LVFIGGDVNPFFYAYRKSIGGLTAVKNRSDGKSAGENRTRIVD
jgi:hypothetical protein